METLLRAAGGDAKQVAEQIRADRSEIRTAMASLQSAAISTPATRNSLSLMAAQWVLFEPALDGAGSGAEGLSTIATASERLMEVANDLTQQYETALKDVLGNV
jgi:hypothetical protein